MKVDGMRVRLKIKEIADARNISISKLHRAADVTYQTVKFIYENPYRDVNISTLAKLASALDVHICALIAEEPDTDS
jgi:DNA-binding Xre family transcriptional regulator